MSLEVLHRIAYLVQSFEKCQKNFSVIMSISDSSAACVGHPGPALDKLAAGKGENPVRGAKGRRNMMLWLQSLNLVAGEHVGMPANL